MQYPLHHCKNIFDKKCLLKLYPLWKLAYSVGLKDIHNTNFNGLLSPCSFSAFFCRAAHPHPRRETSSTSHLTICIARVKFYVLRHAYASASRATAPPYCRKSV